MRPPQRGSAGPMSARPGVRFYLAAGVTLARSASLPPSDTNPPGSSRASSSVGRKLHGEKALDGFSEVDLDRPSQGGFGGAGSTGCGWPARPAVALAKADVLRRLDGY